ncbi:MAG: NRDE family protein [Planctomycetes bacterium]|nr:NRDE family protein [Planctomycetota bacterium]
MCTLTWIALERGYELYFNRDEKLTRAPGLPPRRFAGARRAWLAPADPDGGGTWIGVNERGLTLALLNGYKRADDAARVWRSRGLLVQELLELDDVPTFEARLRALDLSPYRSFTLFAVDPSCAARAANWDGAALAFESHASAGAPLCSSSLDPTGAARARRELFESWRAQGQSVDAALLARFHASHLPERGPLSPCMHRADAQTQSFTRVRCGATNVELAYSPGAPCLGLAPTTLSLERVHDAAARC